MTTQYQDFDALFTEIGNNDTKQGYYFAFEKTSFIKAGHEHKRYTVSRNAKFLKENWTFVTLEMNTGVIEEPKTSESVASLYRHFNLSDAVFSTAQIKDWMSEDWATTYIPTRLQYLAIQFIEHTVEKMGNVEHCFTDELILPVNEARILFNIPNTQETKPMFWFALLFENFEGSGVDHYASLLFRFKDLD